MTDGGGVADEFAAAEAFEAVEAALPVDPVNEPTTTVMSACHTCLPAMPRERDETVRS